jgi:hypothetical protein
VDRTAELVFIPVDYLEAVDIMCKWKVQLKINLYHFRLSTGINTRSPVLFACSRNVKS